MKVLAVSSFHATSTRDVWDKVIVGLRANGVEVVPFDVMQRLVIFAFLEEKAKRAKRELPRDWTPTTLAYEAILGASLYHDCDWVLITSPQHLPNEIPQLIRKAGVKTAAYFTECPYEDTLHAPITAANFDAAFLSDKHSVGLFESFCDMVEYIPHCYDPAIHYPGDEQRDENVIFIGTGYQTRVKFMGKVNWPVRLDLYGWWPREWLRYDNKLRKSLRKDGATTRDETADLYRKSAASFSMHRELRYTGTDEAIMDGEAYSLGPRNWELAACRTFQVSDFRPELEDVFGDSVPQYQSPRELESLLRKAFEEPSWREEMAYRQWERAQAYSAPNVMRTMAQVLAA